MEDGTTEGGNALTKDRGGRPGTGEGEEEEETQTGSLKQTGHVRREFTK